MISKNSYNMIKTWVHKNARDIELSLWRYYFEKGGKEDIIAALSFYQNGDGGFGNALEPDNWNPNSTPYTTLYAISILNDIEFMDLNHPIYKGIMKYLHSEKDLKEYGWRFCVPSNDGFPHAPWWNFNEEANLTESIGVTAQLSIFVLNHADRSSMLYQKTAVLVKNLMHNLLSCNSFGEMGIGGYVQLIDALKKLKFDEYDYTSLELRLKDLVKNSIENDVSKWQYYGVRPSKFITNPQSIFYNENKDVVEKEIKYLIETLPTNDVWGITWTWFDNNSTYAREFAISETWWKSYTAIEKLRFLRNFGYLEE
ncbi:hypothetical protein acsn021_33900 [Anaerocolumna cellulosilytica]|uniref:Uncharacterized protein n=1 Tax=Anaerocolumna cellulosilytica TaxID=433286 RepID=A0A6S6RAD9_9FIRM|nr:hypothetical protein [Anaerocolumna cellulosilytica]MBB5196785.1 hypothetical protein [Anaerocolumna cellulosilytica]BCJ95821.1 hypothetical protein acsn021_33900 [Anaerocolumna cellulosilytica]